MFNSLEKKENKIQSKRQKLFNTLFIIAETFILKSLKLKTDNLTKSIITLHLLEFYFHNYFRLYLYVEMIIYVSIFSIYVCFRI